jgi:hypothetical protein
LVEAQPAISSTLNRHNPICLRDEFIRNLLGGFIAILR